MTIAWVFRKVESFHLESYVYGVRMGGSDWGGTPGARLGHVLLFFPHFHQYELFLVRLAP